jgi:hypothetical protein
MECAGYVAHIREVKDVHKILVGKTERKRFLTRPRSNIKWGLK